MSLEWMIQLATSAGTSLATALGTEAWAFARERFARLLGRGDDERTALAERRLDATAAEIERAPAAERAEALARQQAVWQTRLADLIEEEPAVADDLRALVAELIERLPATTHHSVMHITANDHGTAQGVQHGNIINH
jgi:hypothetical protein